ncbi:hypothetical protein VTO73DRAFT_11717 [Trametes versicolor]
MPTVAHRWTMHRCTRAADQPTPAETPPSRAAPWRHAPVGRATPLHGLSATFALASSWPPGLVPAAGSLAAGKPTALAGTLVSAPHHHALLGPPNRTEARRTRRADDLQ